MDNVCHTLVGVALAEAGLKRRTALGAATLIVGANFPDVDIIAVPLGHALEFRRGWTHGVLALLVLPVVLTGLMLAWDRLVRQRRRRAASEPASAKQLLILATLGILTHPVLDWLNVYGMRWLMPFDGRWFYGDALFIIDPWMWAILVVGVVAARRRWSRARNVAERRTAHLPARWALVAVAAYILVMLATNVAGRRIVRRELTARGFEAKARLMVGPVAVSPFRKMVVFDAGDSYRFGTVTWLPALRFALEEHAVQKGANDPAISAALATPEGRAFMNWARFPFFVIERRAAGTVVRIGDARYTVDPEESWAAVAVPIGR